MRKIEEDVKEVRAETGGKLNERKGKTSWDLCGYFAREKLVIQTYESLIIIQ